MGILSYQLNKIPCKNKKCNANLGSLNLETKFELGIDCYNFKEETFEFFYSLGYETSLEYDFDRYSNDEEDKVYCYFCKIEYTFQELQKMVKNEVEKYKKEYCNT